MLRLVENGQFTILLGDPGVGKSLVALDLAARVTRNSKMPPWKLEMREDFEERVDEELVVAHEASAVALMSGEDSVETVHARMKAAGADLGKVYMSGNLPTLVPERWLPKRDKLEIGRVPEEASMVQLLREDFRRLGCPRMLVLDPLSHFLGGSDVSSAARVRQLLHPLLDLADRRGIAVVGVMHLNKSTHKRNVLHRVMGSMAYVAMARTVMLVTRDFRERGLNGRRLVLPLKSNLAAADHGLAFRIGEGGQLSWEEEEVREHPLLEGRDYSEGLGEVDLFARSRLEFAKRFLREALGSGEMRTVELERQAREAGVAKRTLERARFEVGCEVRRGAEGWIVGMGEEKTGARRQEPEARSQKGEDRRRSPQRDGDAEDAQRTTGISHESTRMNTNGF